MSAGYSGFDADLWTSLDPERDALSGGYEGLISTGIVGGGKGQFDLPSIAPASLLAAPSTSSGSSPEAEAQHSGRRGSNDEYHPPEKHKRGDAPPHSHKNARRGSEGHTHDTDDFDVEAETGAAPAGGRRKSGGGTKAPISEKRRAQNRAAQTAFRERKQAHLQGLEDTISELRADNDERTSENKNLRDLVEQLRQENERLRQGAAQQKVAAPSMPSFLFNVPPSGPPALPVPPRSSSGSSTSPFSAASFSMGPAAKDDVSPVLAKQRSPSLPFDADMFHDAESAVRKVMTPAQSASPDALPPVAKTPSFELPGSYGADPNLWTPRGEHLNDAFFSFSSALSPPGPAIAGASPPAAASPGSWTAFRDPSSASSSGSKPAVGAFTVEDVEQYLNSGNLPSAFALDPAVASPGNVAHSASASQSPQSTTLMTPVEGDPCAVIDLSRQFGVAEPDLDILCAEFKQKATCQEAARQALQRALAGGQSGGIDDVRRVLANSQASWVAQAQQGRK